jgi:hypothetical protein
MGRMTNIAKSARPINMAYQHLADKKAQYYYSWATFYRIQNKWKNLLQEHSYLLVFAEIYWLAELCAHGIQETYVTYIYSQRFIHSSCFT